MTDEENDPELPIVDLSQHPSFSEEELGCFIERCYSCTSSSQRMQEKKQLQHSEEFGLDFLVFFRIMKNDFSMLLHQEDDVNAVPFDVTLVGRNHETGQDEWSVGAHTAILCAHSEYAVALLTHGWTCPRASDSGSKMIELDSRQFSRDVVDVTVRACYTNSLWCVDTSLNERTPPEACLSIEVFFRLHDLTMYLGMDAISMLVVDNMLSTLGTQCLPEILGYAHQVGSPYLLEEVERFCARRARKLSDGIRALPRSLSSSPRQSEPPVRQDDNVALALFAS